MPNEQDGKLKFGRSYVYLDPDSLASTPDAATPGVWRVKSGVDNSGDPSIGFVNAVNTRAGNVTLTSADVGLANVNNTSDANKPVSTAQQTALNAKIDTTTANNTLLGITAKAADSELLDGLNSTSFVQTNTQFGGDVSGAYNAIVISDDSHNHIISNVDGLQSALDIKADLVGGLVPTNQLPAIAITEYLGSVSSQSALLALTGQKGDWAIRSDTSTTWIITGTTPSNIGSWTELQYPAAPVSSVNGATGTVVLGHSDVGAASTAQGTTADSAIQPGDNISQLTNNSGFISATLTDEEVQDIIGGMVSGNTENGITVTYQDTDGTIDFDVASQSDNNFTTVLKNKLDAIEVSATADQTASEIITSLLTVDGANSGLDSDLLDGQHGAYYLDYTNFTNTPTFENANKLDNLDSTQFLRSDAADVKTSGTLNFSDDVKLTLGTSDDLEIYHNGSNSYIDNTTGSLYLRGANGTHVRVQAKAGEESIVAASDGSVELYYDNVKKIETTNAGASVTGTLTATAFSGAGGSVTGVNAAQLNSQNASYYLDYSNFSNTPTIPTNNNQLTNGAGYLTSPDGGDAITLDGLDSTDFLRSNADDTFTGQLTVTGNLLLSDQVRIGNDAWIEDFDGANAIRVKGNTDSTQGYIAFGNRTEKLGCNNSATLSYDGNTIWNAGNDGSGSGLDADTVDGLNPNVSSTASSIAVRDSSSDMSLRTIKSTFADESTISGAVGYRINNSTDNSLRFCSNMSAVRTHMGTNNASNLTTGTIPIARISGGAGTGLDADLLDGVQGSSYLRSDISDTFTGTLTGQYITIDGAGPNYIRFLDDGSSTLGIDLVFRTGANTLGFEKSTNGGQLWYTDCDNGVTNFIYNPTVNSNDIWHAGNDGAASGLDADLLDGQHGSYYLNYNNLTNLPAGGGSTEIGAGNSKAEIIDTGTDGRFIVTTEGSERLRIDSSGKVGIGTTSPSSLGTNITTVEVKGGSATRSGGIRLSTSDDSQKAAFYVYDGAGIVGTETAHPLGFYTGNTQRMRIDSSGNVGIGTTTPGNYLASAHQLVISDSASTGITIATPTSSSGTLAFADGTGTADNARGLIRYGHSDNSLQFSTNATERMRIDSSGRVGIGTTSPDTKLDVYGNVQFGDGGGFDMNINGTRHQFSIGGSEKMRIDSSGALAFNGSGLIKNQAANTLTMLSGGNASNAGANILLYGQSANPANTTIFRTSASERMRIDSTGNVGINESTPDSKLDIVYSTTGDATTQKLIHLRTDGTAGYVSRGLFVKIGRDGQYDNSAVHYDIVGSAGNSGTHIFETNSSERMRIDSTGNVKIGTGADRTSLLTSTSANLQVDGGIVFEPGSGNDAEIYNYRGTSMKFGTSGTERMRIDGSGLVGLGTSSPTEELHISGAGDTRALITSGGTGDAVMMFENASGNIWGHGLDFSSGNYAIGYNSNGNPSLTSQGLLNINSSGNVGIKATNPLAQLHIANTSGTDGFYLSRANGSAIGDSVSIHMLSDSSKIRLYSYGDALTFWTGAVNGTAAERMRIDSSGVVTIGGNTAWHAGNDGSGSGLDADTVDGIQASNFLRSDTSDQMSGELNVSRNGGATGTGAPNYSQANIELQTSSNHVPAISFHRGGYSASTLYERDGELYVNAWTTRAQTGKLVSFGNDGSGSGLDADTVDGIQASSFLRSDAADTASGELTFNGRVNINGHLDLPDNEYLYFGSGDDVEFFCDGSHMYMDLNSGIGNFYIRDGSTTRFTFDDNGSFTASANVTAYSDITLKTNVKVISNALKKVQEIQGITYNRIDLDDGIRYAGVSAQDVEKVMPEVVQTDDKGIKSVAYGNLVSLLIEAIKEQQDQIDELKTLVNQI